jgi:sialidase-1
MWSAEPGIRIPGRGRGFRRSALVYSSPNSTNSRAAGRIHLSCDEGARWTAGKLLYDGKFGYSVMTVLDDGSLGVFFERSRREGFSVDVEHLSFVRLTRDWLSSEPGAVPPGVVGSAVTTDLSR